MSSLLLNRGPSSASHDARRRDVRRIIPAAALVLLGWLVQVPAGYANESWDLQLAFPSSLLVIGETGSWVAVELTSRSGSDLSVQAHEPGVFSSGGNAVNAVANGTVEAAFTTAGFSTGTIPSLAFFAAVPFGPEGLKLYEFARKPPGSLLLQGFYDRLGVKAIPCGMTGPEGGGWFRNPITTIDDFNGLRMRIFGYGGDVLQRLGTQPVLLSGGNVYPSLQNGTIDAAEFSTPYIDEPFNFDDFAPNYYYPSWHQRDSLLMLVINPAAWARIGAQLRTLVKTVCDDAVQYSFNRDRALTGPALQRLEDRGVVIREFPQQVTDTLETEWNALATELAESDPDFARTLRVYQLSVSRSPVSVPALPVFGLALLGVGLLLVRARWGRTQGTGLH